MRVFASLVPSESAVQHLVGQMGSDYGQLSGLDWTDPDVWHLNLAYFGNISQRDLDRLDNAMEPLTKAWGPVEAKMRGVRGFPDDAEAESIYTEVVAHEADLAQFSRDVVKAVQGFGWLLDRRTFRPHITLARAPQRHAVDVRTIAKRYQGYLGPSWVADAIAVLWARPGESGAEMYEIVGAYPLQGA